MDCAGIRESIVARLYGEALPEDDAALDVHLASCAACTAKLGELGRVRAALRDGEPAVPRSPRVVVLREGRALRPALVAASILAGALIAGGAAGSGYAFVRHRIPGGTPTPAIADGTAQSERSLDPETANLIEREVQRRVESALHAETSPAAPSGEKTRPLTTAELQAALSRLERRVDGDRAADLRYFMGQLAASEVRTGQRIGQTNQALRYVALASNPHVSEQ